MGITCHYLNVRPEEIEPLLRHPQRIDELMEDVERGLDIDKAWDGLAALLTGLPVDVVFGGTPLETGHEFPYGQPRYLSPEQVVIAAESLPGVLRYDGTAMTGVYPGDDDEAYYRRHYAGLWEFFSTCAKNGDAVVVTLL
ncbi:DUF1877 family protein [Herbidospora cretacea]|uniref:DUF1877 family protein n=1 Tax=Herbidospora cretacea TaxID=28444 RepID=UPI000555D660|nr:DUF1877 family protein [Herbidospora cretacea]